MQKILFIGATGLIGKPVAKELIRSGFSVTMLARNSQKAEALFPGATIVNGDVTDKNSLVNAMKGMEAVYINLSVAQSSRKKDQQPEREGIDNIIAAAKQTGLKRIVYLSSLVHFYEGMNGFHWWVFQIKAAAVQKIKSCGIPYTIFYPSTFMESYIPIVKGNNILMIGDSKAPMWFIAASDYARQVAASFRLLTHENKDYVIQGPEAFTWDQANKVYSENYTAKKLKPLKSPAGVMKFLARFHPKFSYGWHICEALNKYPEKFEASQSWKELGKPETTLAEYAKTR